MEIPIPKSLEALVRRKVEDGHHSTEDEVIADALRLMQARDEVAEIKRARLKDAIDRGCEDAASGKTIRLETDDQIVRLSSPTCEAPRAHGDRPRRYEVDTPVFNPDLGPGSNVAVHGGDPGDAERARSRHGTEPQS
jgi:putative addiction module CopG family antidote